MVIKLLIIITVSFLLFHRTLKYGYVMDDIDAANKQTQRKKKFWIDLWNQLRGNYYFNPKIEHAMSLFFHIFNCCLIYLFFGKSNISFLAALLFCVNPANNQGAVWLSAKPYSIATSMILLGIFVPVLFPIFYPLTFFWSANTILSPLLFLIKKPNILVLLLPICCYLLKKRVSPIIRDRYEHCTSDMQYIGWKKIIIVLKTYGYYFRFAIFPFRMGLCHSYLSTFGLSPEETKPWYKLDKYFWLGITVFLSMPIGYLLGWNIFGLLWFTLFIAQWLNYLSVNHLISERYLYLANIGLMYLLAEFILKTVGLPLAAVVLTYYVTRMWYHLPAYLDYREFFKSNVENFDNVAMAYNQYGLGAVNYGNQGTGLDIWIRGVQTRPKDFRLNYNVANLLIGAGKIQEAVGFIKGAEKALDPKNNYDFWAKNIVNLKAKCKEGGIDVDKVDLVAVSGN